MYGKPGGRKVSFWNKWLKWKPPTICKVIEEGATILVCYYEISNL